MGALFWAGMHLARWAASKLGGGVGRGGEPGVIHGEVARGSSFEWLAVSAEHINQFLRDTRGNPRLLEVEAFVNMVKTAVRQGRLAAADATEALTTLGRVCDVYPTRLLFIWDGR